MPDRTRQSWHIRWLDLARGVPGAEIEASAVALETRSYRPGELLIGPETPDEGVYLINEGTVRLFQRGPGGREITIDLIGPGWLLGLGGLFGVPGDGVLAEAASGVRVGVARPERIWQLMAEQPRVILNLFLHLASRLVETEEQLERLALADARGRLAGVLARLATRVGEPRADGGRQLPAGLRHVDLARQIGSSRETVTRLLGRLEREGYIRREPGRLIALDPAGLAALSTAASRGEGRRSRGRRPPAEAPARLPASEAGGRRGGGEV